MQQLSAQQKEQERGYKYPYHYIPTWNGNTFSQTQTLVWGFEYLSYLFFVLDRVMEIGFESLLDVGCGDGRFLAELRHRAPGKRLVGLDYSQRAIDYAKIMTPGIEWVLGDIREQSILDEEFDLITLVETLEHIPPDEVPAFLRSISRFLKETGRFIITVPSTNISVSRKHYQHFDLESLTNALHPLFEVVDVSYLNKKSAFRLEVIKMVLVNRLFILNSKRLLAWIYRYYTSNLLVADRSNCRRIALICKKSR